MIELVPIISPIEPRNRNDWLLVEANDAAGQPGSPGTGCERRDPDGRRRDPGTQPLLFRARMGTERLEAPFAALGEDGLPLAIDGLDLSTARQLARLASHAVPENWTRVRKTAFEPSLPDSLPMRLALSHYDGGHLLRADAKGQSWSVTWGSQVVTVTPDTGIDGFPSFCLLMTDTRYGGRPGYLGAPDRGISLAEIEERWKNVVYMGIGIRPFPEGMSAHELVAVRRRTLEEIRAVVLSTLEKGLWQQRKVSPPMVHESLDWTVEGVPVGATGEPFWRKVKEPRDDDLTRN